ncbi:M24 family metallopeptidase [Pararhodobacter sp. SW119]|uniref:M24 family metallopeptidase n=1 Tax=Pararhodobacter sp. SW119 TaxID=2780075 RepID=UPI001AE07C5D|nr:M24 family metallopeptidase [Pararhodobacter sp. SW119]
MDLKTTDFTPQDYAARLARIRHGMEAAGVDTMIITDPSNMAWATGYDGWSFYVHQAVVVGSEGAPIWWGRGIDAAGARRTIIGAPDDAIRSYDDSYVQNDDKHPMETLANLLAEKEWDSGVIGVELENYYYSAKAHAVLVEHLPKATIIDATALVNWQRTVKSRTEIERMRRAARIVEAMHHKILEVAEPGLPKHQLVAEILRAAVLGADGHWGDYAAIVPMAPSGLDATAPHLTWDDRPMQKDESHFFEIAGVYRRYHVPLSRTLYFTEPPTKYRQAEAAVQEATEAGLAQARPGNTCDDIANAFNTTLERHGFYKENRCGYSIGLSYPPDWGERTMSLRRGDETVLEPGMCLHFMPALWLDDGGLEITESILITDTGVEKFCSLPGEIFLKT